MLKLIMAVSNDGFTARGPTDNMRWTGFSDKQAFKLLMSTHPILLVGRQTHDVMPALPYRRVVCISRNPDKGLSLGQAMTEFPDAWLGGGTKVAVAALEAGLVGLAYICRSSAVLGGGDSFDPVKALLPKTPRQTIVLDLSCTIEIYRLNYGA